MRRRVFFFYFFSIIVVGVLLVTFAGAFEPSNFSRIAEVIGAAVIVTGIATALHDYLLYKRVTYKYFRLLEGANKAGFVNVFADREAALEEIKELIPLARREIRLLGVSLTDFMSPDFRQAINRFINSNITIRILFLNKESSPAKERAEREEGDKEYTKTQLFSDLETCERFFDDLERRLKQPNTTLNLDYKSYRTNPSLFIVVVDNQLFYEPYHLGLEETEIVLPFARCLGKRVPVIQIDNRARAFSIIMSHFDHLWDVSSTKDKIDKA